MNLVCFALYLFMILIFVRIVLSWFPASEGLFMTIQRLVFSSTEWAMGPLRRVLPPVRLGAAALDLSPLVILLGITVLRSILCV
ncbi:MAG: YggT family protein [Microthrixaceae bacterium]